MRKIGVIGDKDSILGFKALGLSIFPVIKPEEAADILDDLAQQSYAVVFITEQIAQNIQDTIDKYKNSVFPAVILIPNNRGTLGLGIQGIKESVEKAVGADILFGKEGR
ncbi:MAG: V-type ATP synthase subunit F [Clostridia bacterium]|nr:V-type ATP synthase subunit F [Clostridia bacterium]